MELTYIGGLDCSSSSPALFILGCDPKTLDIVSTDYRAITPKKKQKTSKRLQFFDSKDFTDYIDKYTHYSFHLLHTSCILNYVAVEDYAFAATGRITLLSEICGMYKKHFYDHKSKIRLYAPPTWKKCFTGHGHADKLTIYQEFEKRIADGQIVDFVKEDDLPIVDKGTGVAPTSDIIDAFGLAETLRIELKVRNNMIDLPQHQLETFRLTGKVKPADLAEAHQNKPFLEKYDFRKSQ